MDYILFAWLRRNSCFLVITGLAALAMGGCPPTGGTGNGNDNEPPPGQDLIEVTTVGQGSVDQTADGNMVTLTADPDEGWIFDGWSGAQVSDQSAESIIVDATEVSSITANFIEDTEPPRPVNTCGDGVLDRSEQCDDANKASGDGCSSTCQIETPTDFRCGDGVVNGTEECDAGRETAACNSDCTTSHCGDGALNVHAGEQCDDGNTTNGDDCSSRCRNETLPPSGCGDGVVNGTEECDDDGGETVTCNDNCTTSRCGDGNLNTHAGEQCDDKNTVSGDGCSPTCQIETGGGGPPPPPPPQNCGNGVIDAPEECDGPGETATCNSNCTTSECGDGIVNAHALEQCDGGIGCGVNCQREAIANDRCSAAEAVGDGTRSYSSIGATTDGPETSACDFGFVDRGQVGADIWYCYTASCTGTALVSLCGSDYDTKLAVYAGCDCPTTSPLKCSDDDCGSGVENVQSRVTFAATAGQSYLVRVGGYNSEQGEGRLTTACNVDACANSSGDCFAASPSEAPGCDDPPGCCATMCDLDQFCCDVTWDAQCASEAQGVCTGSFPACAAGAGLCSASQNTPGCDNVDCCNTVCAVDPYCCITAWDSISPSQGGGCVERANSMCFLTCGRGAGDCHTVHGTSGCESEACCAAVCGEDHFCCDSEWDQVCVDLAAKACP